MSVIGSNILAGASGQGGYFIDRSLRFRSSSSAYLSRTFGTPTNSAKWTFSRWLKRGAIGARQSLFAAGSSGSSYANIEFKSDDTIQFLSENSSLQFQLVTTQVFRDPSAWYNIHIIYDSANATSTDRIQLWVNGVRVTAFSTATYPSSPNNLFNTAIAHQIGVLGYGSVAYFDGYMTEINFIDGQALDPTYFGEYNEDTGVWQPIKYTGTYGTNGFYLNFSDNTSTTTLGYDTSGNGNNWTANNISVTAGATYDSMTDVPTLTSTDAANYATLNPLADVASSPNYGTLSNANLKHTESGSGTGNYLCTMAIPSNSGKWYFEITADTLMPTYAYYPVMGLFPVGSEAAATLNFAGYNVEGLAYYSSGGYYVNNSTSAGSGTSISAGQTRCFAYDSDTGKLWIRTNGGAWENSGDPDAGTNPFATLDGALDYFPYAANYQSSTTHNFGQRPFAYTPPAGFKSLNTYNLPDSTIEDGSQYFDVRTWSGDSVTPKAVVTDLGFQPDLIWAKTRSTTYDHMLFDSVRGAGSTKDLSSNTTTEEGTSGALYGYVSSIDSAGFTATKGSQATNVLNQSGQTFVAWNWKANGSGVTNNEGTIESTVSANPTAGFSIVTYTGNGTAGATVGHGLNDAPKMVIVKTRESSNTWRVGHDGLTSWAYQLRLDEPLGEALNNNIFNSTAPTSTVFTVGSSATTNESTKGMVAYCFTDVEGYSKFGSYTGNGDSDGPFVYLGFRPAFLIVKRTSSTAAWNMRDSERNPNNPLTVAIYANENSEESDWSLYPTDLLSNGFKVRTNAGGTNASGNTYIYAAFAENPFKNALAR